MSKRRIAIVGGGTAGAASALLLARNGHRVTLFERVEQPTAVGAGILLQPSGMRVLAELGLLDRILAHGARSDRLLGTTAAGRVVLDVRYRDWDASRFGLGLHRGALFSVLWQALADVGVELRRATAIDTIVPRSDAVELAAAGQSCGVFDGVVIADGTRSLLRAATGIAHRVTPYPWGALWTIVPDDGLATGTLRQWFGGAQQMLGLMSTGCNYLRPSQPLLTLFWSLRADRLAAWREAGLQAWKNAVLALAPIEPVLAHIHTLDQLTYASYADVRMRSWHRGRVVCIGDCAHATSPQLGQGANLALVDALTLAQCLARPGEVAPAFAEYSRRRRAHLRYYQAASRGLTPLFQSDSRIAGALRDTLLGPLCRLPGVRYHMAKTLGGTKTGWLFGELR